jgi:hypothetical protein
VGPDHDNKRHHDEIELTTVLLVVVARVELALATAHGGDRRRRSGRLGVLRRGGQIGANKRACEVAWVLRDLVTCLDGGELEPGELAPAAAAMAAGCSGGARRGGRGLLYPARAARG